MNMNIEIALFFIVQSVIIIGAILTGYIKLRVALNTCEVGMEHINDTTTRIEEDAKLLTKKVDGISSHVSKIEGKLNSLD